MRKPVVFREQIDAVKIPEGKEVTIDKGLDGFIVQTRGGNVTIRIPEKIWQVQITADQVDALETPDGDSVELDLEEVETTEFTEVPENMEEAVQSKLQECYDPEIPVNIVELGLVYGVDVEQIESESYDVEVKMTLTAQGCGMGNHIAGEAQRKIVGIPGVDSANVEIVWDPPWTEDMMSEDAQKQLGMV